MKQSQARELFWLEDDIPYSILIIKCRCNALLLCYGVHLFQDEKLQDVLGHFQKDFEGGVSAENLGEEALV